MLVNRGGSIWMLLEDMALDLYMTKFLDTCLIHW